jgi:hypothetical protein
MRGRVLIWISLGLNVVFAGALVALILRRSSPLPDPNPGWNPLPVSTNALIRTNTIVRRLNFVWSQIESRDYRTYIANLRSIGCPEPTIRDIIVAELNEIFARRRDAEVVTPSQQWWRSDPDPDVMSAANDKLRALESERRAMLTSLLGPEWQSSEYPYPDSPRGNALDGSLLGALSLEAKHQVREIQRRSIERRDAYLESVVKDGTRPDQAEIEQLRQQTRNELAKVLSADQLEEYLLRYSQVANDLRDELRGLDASPGTFRSLFRLRDPIDQELQSLSGATSEIDVRKREELIQKRDSAVSQVLGPEQFQEYKLNQDLTYRDSKAIAQQTRMPEDKIRPFYDINHTTESEERRIQNDSRLTEEERASALVEIRGTRANALRRLLGDEFYQRYQDSLSQ